MKVIYKRDVIRNVRGRWEEQYQNYESDYKLVGLPLLDVQGKPIPNSGPTVGEIRAALAALNLENCSSTDVDAAMGVAGWADNRCLECGKDCDSLIQIGEEPNYEAQWVDLCIGCLEKALKLLKDDVIKSLFPRRTEKR
jgi:hypothetical protein